MSSAEDAVKADREKKIEQDKVALQHKITEQDKIVEQDKMADKRQSRTFIFSKAGNRDSGRFHPSVILTLPLDKSVDRTVSSTPTGLGHTVLGRVQTPPPTPLHLRSHPLTRKGSMTVRDLQHNPRQYAQFQKQVIRESATENLDFDTRIEQLKKLHQEIEISPEKESLEKKLQADCVSIYDAYLAPTSKVQITLNYELFLKLQEEYLNCKKDGSGFNSTSLNLFLEAQEKINQDLAHGPALRLKQSDTFKKISNEDQVIRKLNHDIGAYLHKNQADEDTKPCCCFSLCSIDMSKVYANLKDLHEAFEEFLNKSDSKGEEITPIIDASLQTHRKLIGDRKAITLSKDAIVIALRDAISELQKIDDPAVQVTPSLSAQITSPRQSQKLV